MCVSSRSGLLTKPTSFFWGTLSDRIGRRPVLLIGLAGNIFTSVLFGTSQSFAWAVCARAAAGLLNGNISVVKTYLRYGSGILHHVS
jgi:MFS family permease